MTNLLKYVFVSIIPAIICSLISALFLTPVYQVVVRLLYAPFVRERKVQEAKEKGHVLTAYGMKQTTILEETKDGSLRSSGQRYVEYEYEYNGKKYRYMGKTASDYPNKITLYFDDDPKYADTEYLYSPSVYNWKKHYLVVTGVTTVVITIMIVAIAMTH